MRILHVVPSFYPAFYHGGPIYSLYGLCNALARQGLDLRVLTTDTAGPGRRVPAKNFPMVAASGYPVYYCRRKFAVSGAPGLLWHMIRLIRWADLVHLTAVYSFPTIPTLLLCGLLDKPVVWSPRGSLQRWEGSTRVALKTVWERVCRLVAPRRLILHLTSRQEEKESLERVPGVRTAVVPNGIEIGDQAKSVASDGTLRLLYLGRLDPKKGIENLLAACKILNDNSKVSWCLSIAGSGEPSYAESIRSRIHELELSGQAKMVGEVVGETKQQTFENSDMLILPSYTENFGMVVAEALAHGLPVIASKGTPWQRIGEIGCGLWVDNTPQELAGAIEQMSRLPLCKMGQRGRDWMQKEFSWEKRSEEMIDLYRDLVEHRPYEPKNQPR